MNSDVQALLQAITELSHEFGTTDYVRGGGGNTSVKNESTVWVKPSGTTLGGLTPEAFVGLDRAKLAKMYGITPPDDASAREALVKEIMTEAKLAGMEGRPSVEAPLHESLSARFVVHTHPGLVNGMTCGKDGKALCVKLFPEALWLDYIDPGYTLCMQVRDEILSYKNDKGCEPSQIFLKNHGVFVAADTEDGIRDLYASMFTTLKQHYAQANVSLDLDVASGQASDEQTQQVVKALGGDMAVCSSGMFAYSTGPISPDHLVYAKSYSLIGEPTEQSVAQFKDQHGYLPQVIVWGDYVYGAAASDKRAALALEMAQDGALVQQLAAAFGGIEFMTDRARLFIENWEVESYRSKQL